MRKVLPVLVVAAFFAAFSPLHAQNWRPVGPAGGDVRTLAADPSDPNVIYLGASDGHVFGSRDGGGRWQLLGRIGNRTDSIVTAILVDTRSSASLYAATWSLGPGGGGVFRSSDAGRTWRAAGLAGESVRALAQAPGHPEILIAGTLTGVYRSTNAGGRWECISPANHEDLRNFDSLAIDPANPQIIYAGTYHLPWKTMDGGRNWAPIHTGMVDDSDVMSIRIDHTDSSRLYASACSGIYRGEDGGARWTKFRGIPPTARRTHLILQDPARPQTLYSVTTQGLWKTLDGGAVWTRMTSARWSTITLLIHPKNPDRLVIGVEGQGIYVSDDGAKSFRAANSGFYHRQVMDLAYDREHPGRMLVVLTNSAEPVVATHDGGLTWRALGPGLQTHMLRHAYAAPDGWWAALKDGGWMRYDEKKSAWVRAGAMPGAAPAPALAKRRGKAAPVVAKATAAARPFRAVVNDMAFGRSIWLAATEEGLMASGDRGATWAPFTLAVLPRQAVHSVRMSADGSQIWLVSSRALMSSRDAGRTWNTQSLGYDSRSALRLHVLDDGTLLLSSSHSIDASTDSGARWQAVNLPEPSVQAIAVAGSALLVSTEKHGLQISYNRGRNWERIEGPVSEGSFPVLAAGATFSSVLAGSATEGLYSLDIAGARAAATANASGTIQPAPRQPQK